MDKPQKADNTQKDPDDWKSGGEPATGAQEYYIETMADEVDEKVPDDLTKAEASKKIEELRQKTGRDD